MRYYPTNLISVRETCPTKSVPFVPVRMYMDPSSRLNTRFLHTWANILCIPHLLTRVPSMVTLNTPIPSYILIVYSITLTLPKTLQNHDLYSSMMFWRLHFWVLTLRHLTIIMTSTYLNYRISHTMYLAILIFGGLQCVLTNAFSFVSALILILCLFLFWRALFYDFCREPH